MSDTENGTPSNPFDEVPSWYDVPELSEAELNSGHVPPPPRNSSAAAGVGHSGPRTTGGSSNGSSAIVVFVALVSVVGALAYFLLPSLLGSSGELSVGDCANPVETESAVELAVVSARCGNSDLGEVLAEFEAGGLAEMPADHDLFWDDAVERCLDLIGEDQFAAIDGAIIPLGLPTAQTNADWAAGDTTIMCTVITEERFERFTETVLG